MARPTAAKEIFNRFTRMFNLPVKIEHDCGRAVFKLPGIQYNDFDRAGYVNIYKVNRFLEGVRPVTMTHLYDELASSSQGHFVAFFAQHCYVYEPFYKGAALAFPMNVDMSFIAMGRTSVIREINVTHDVSKELLVSSRQRLVNMELNSGKSIDLPSDFRERLTKASETKPEDVFPKIMLPSVSENHFSSAVVVHHSDLDFIFHTNQASYLRFALDCAAKAAKAGFFSEIKDDVCFYRAKYCSTYNMGETFVGDHLVVKVWEEVTDPYVLHFNIMKENLNVYYTKIEFYND